MLRFRNLLGDLLELLAYADRQIPYFTSTFNCAKFIIYVSLAVCCSIDGRQRSLGVKSDRKRAKGP